MWVIQMKIDRQWHTVGGKFLHVGAANDKISQYMLATTTNKQSREYRTKRI